MSSTSRRSLLGKLYKHRQIKDTQERHGKSLDRKIDTQTHTHRGTDNDTDNRGWIALRRQRATPSTGVKVNKRLVA